jgi:UDP:flavonoid glycosyltransferase YjiC (YdhE family)
MRVLLTTPSSTLRMHALAPIGWALRSAGHEVLMACHREFAAAVNRTGLVAVDVDDLVEFAEVWRPGLVLWDQRAPAGSVAARSCDAASVLVRGFADHADHADHAGPAEDAPHDAVLDSTPPSMRTLTADRCIDVRYVPYHGPAEIPSWLRRTPRRPRILVALPAGGTVLAVLSAAVDGLDVEVVCATDVDRVPHDAAIPDNVRLLTSVPVTALLRTCAAVVHDASLTAAAWAFGLPQIVLAPDADAPSKDEMSALATDNAVRARAERLRAETLAMPGPPDVVAALVGLADPKAVDSG